MPLYEIHHSCDFTKSQRQSIASAITNLHCTTFSTPSAFVNVIFQPNYTMDAPSNIYVGGSSHCTNYIIGHLRPRPNNDEKLTHVVKTISAIWNEHARPEDNMNGVLGRFARKAGVVYTPKRGDGRLDDERTLHNVFLMEDIVAGMEQGFMLPKAGKDVEWARENMEEFARRAKDGDESMKKMMREYKAKL
jgi:phenylpyruvate tautomerase PptA (4-oxalocrotonate tautomerase family)